MLKKENVGRVFAKTARLLPGIGSYQDRESTREADKALRMRMSGSLTRLLESVEALKSRLAKKGAIKNILPLEDLTRHLEKASREMQFASRGYSPVFSRQEIDEEALEHIYERDTVLLDQINELEKAVEALIEKAESPWDGAVKPIRQMLSRLEKGLQEREEAKSR